VSHLAGTLLAPAVTLDLAEMVAAIQVRANELEVDRLEALRIEDAERQRAAAQERNRLIEAQRQRAAAEAERLAAEEAARQAQAQRAEEERQARELQRQAPAVPAPTGTLDLTLPGPTLPPVSGPVSPAL
jgi:septal ring factor EnvC (AmiA/AmiB activator)